MKRLSVILIVLLPVALVAGSIDVVLNFSPSDFSFEKANGYDVVSMAGEYHTSEAGKPLLPLVSRSLLIPPDAEVTDIRVVSSDAADMPGEYNIHPAQRPLVISAKSRPAFVSPDAAVYQSSNPYPAQIAGLTQSGCLAGYRIANISLSPLQYIPAAKRLRLNARLVLRITYTEGVHQVFPQTASQRSLFGQEVAALIVNEDRLSMWAPPLAPPLDGQTVDMIVITNRTLASSFQTFADWKTKKGYKTLILGTDTIYARYPGADNQTKIRNCITDYWQNHGLKFVLLGGDAGIIPVRTCHLTVESMTSDIPADMYYGDLQYSWNSDHNSYYGEMTDSVDLYHDVYVGRVPADNATDVATFIKKDTMFEKHPDPSYLKSLILPSEMLFDPYHGRVANNLIAGTFPTGWKIARLEDPSSSATPESLRLGYELGHICCHGNYDLFGSILDISQVPSITCGNKTSIINSIACLTGEFDDQECIAEELVNFSGGACVADLCNSREGYGYPPAVGPSELIDLEYYRQLNDRGCCELGAMNSRSKDYYHGLSMNQEVWRWCIYELTLFGDPSLPVWTEAPASMNVSYAGSVPAAPQTMRVSVAQSGSPLADAQVCLMMGSSVYAVGRTNSLGWVDLFISPAATGTMNVTVTARNCSPFEGACSVVSGSNQPAIVLQSVLINDQGNHNGKLDPGETATLLVCLKNSGSASASSLNGLLRTTSPYITLTDSSDGYGSVAAGDTSAGAGYQVTVSSGTPAGADVELYVHAASTEGSWEPFFELTVGVKPDRKLWADHDTGNCILSVTSFGSIGTIAPYNEGSGFKYPRTVSNGSLYAGSFMVGTDSGYIVDRFYGHPSSTINTDWRILDTLHRVIPPEAGAQEYRATYDDGLHSRAKRLTVQQWSASNKQAGYDDFVVLQFDLWNSGAGAIGGLYAGIMTDFDVYNVQSNAVKSDTVRRMTYMYDPAGSGEPYVGIRLLYPLAFANLSAIKNSQYVTPSAMMSEAVKDSLLRGRIRVRNSTSTTNWSEVVSAGPFNIPVNWYQRVAFAFVGGSTENELKYNSDSAQAWYLGNTGKAEPARTADLRTRFLSVEPSMARDFVRISYAVEGFEPITIGIYDLSGKLVAGLYRGTPGRSGTITWRPGSLQNGIYFVKLDAASGSETAKVIIER